MKRNYIIVTLTLLIIASSIFFTQIQNERSGYIDGQEAVRIMYAVEANNHLEELSKNIRFSHDTSILSPESYVLLDSIITVIKTYEREGFRYILQIHSHRQNSSDAEEITYSQLVAGAIKHYIVDADISSEIINAVGLGRKNRLCFDETEADCFCQNNRLEIQVD